MFEPDKTLIRRLRLHFAVPFILFFLLTIGNYSFFRYTIDGSLKNSLVSTLAQIRLILPLWPILYAFQLNLPLSIRILKHNIDVLTLLIFWFLSSAFSINPESYLLYNTWSALTIVAVLLATSYIGLVLKSHNEFVSFLLNLIWVGNSIVLLLIVISFWVQPPVPGIYRMLYSSNSFWAYPLLIIGIISVIKNRWGNNSTRIRKLTFMLVVVICWIAIYLSARRGPLLVLSLAILLTYLPNKFPHILLFIGVGALLLLAYEPKKLLHHLPDSFMKYRLKRLAGLVRVQKETSYEARRRIWSTYMEGFYDNPFLGTGQSGKLMNENNSPKDGYLSPHNTFIGLLSEKGLLGTGLLAMVIVRSLLLINPELRRLYLILFIPTIVINWVEYNLLPGQIFFLYSIMIWLLPRGIILVQKEDSASH